MKADTHPAYYANTKIVCACGNTIAVGSTVEDIHIELCSACHPFYTGKQNLVDTSGRVEKFETRSKAKVEEVGGKKVKAAKRAAQKEAKKSTKATIEA